MAALALMVCFAGCKKKVSPLVGNWTFDSMDGMSLSDLKDFEEVTGTKIEYTVTLNADGTGEMKAMGQTAKLKWDEASKTVEVDGEKVPLTLKEDGKLSLKLDESEIVFAKQK